MRNTADIKFSCVIFLVEWCRHKIISGKLCSYSSEGRDSTFYKNEACGGGTSSLRKTHENVFLCWWWVMSVLDQGEVFSCKRYIHIYIYFYTKIDFGLWPLVLRLRSVMIPMHILWVTTNNDRFLTPQVFSKNMNYLWILFIVSFKFFFVTNVCFFEDKRKIIKNKVYLTRIILVSNISTILDTLGCNKQMVYFSRKNPQT